MSKRGETTKQQIIDAALSLFREGGFKSLRISRVCERANISPTSVYWHFSDKAGLIQAVLESAFEPIGDDLIAGQRNVADASKFIHSLEKLVVEQPVGALTMLSYISDSLEDPDVASAIRLTRGRELRNQKEIICNSLGVDEATAECIAIQINACVNYAAMVKQTGGSKHEVRQVLNTLKPLLENAKQ